MAGPRSRIERALWNELRCGGDVGRSEAAVRLAGLLRNRGELDAARELLDYAPATVDPAAASRAWLACAELLDETGDEVEALRAYRQAGELVSPRHSPDVAIDLAARAQENGNVRGAARLYEAVIAAAPAPSLAAVANLRLAAIQLERTQVKPAIASLRAARELCGPGLLPAVELALAEALLGSGAGGAGLLAEAEELLSSVVASDHPDLAPQAALRLGTELGSRGELVRAYELLGAVVACRHPDFAPLAEAETSLLMHRELDSFGPAEDPPRRLPPPRPRAARPTAPVPGGSRCPGRPPT
jgi:tetratricopeptide (TPR) repeat protein